MCTGGPGFALLLVGRLLIGTPDAQAETGPEPDYVSNRHEDSFLRSLSSALTRHDKTVRVYYATDHCPAPEEAVSKAAQG